MHIEKISSSYIAQQLIYVCVWVGECVGGCGRVKTVIIATFILFLAEIYYSFHVIINFMYNYNYTKYARMSARACVHYGDPIKLHA